MFVRGPRIVGLPTISGKAGNCSLLMVLMMFDTFHFAQTRMGTVDSFLGLFMMIICQEVQETLVQIPLMQNLILLLVICF